MEVAVAMEEVIEGEAVGGTGAMAAGWAEAMVKVAVGCAAVGVGCAAVGVEQKA